MGRKGLNIYHRKDGRWEGQYKDGFHEDVRPKYHSVYAKTYSEIKEKIFKIRASTERHVAVCTITV